MQEQKNVNLDFFSRNFAFVIRGADKVASLGTFLDTNLPEMHHAMLCAELEK